jgi:hypothetical protein
VLAIHVQQSVDPRLEDEPHVGLLVSDVEVVVLELWLVAVEFGFVV